MKLSTQVASRNTAKIFLYENQIIKVFNDFLPDTESIYEANKQRFARAAGLCVPEIFDVTTIDGKQAIIMEFVKGKTLGEILLENKDHAEHYMNISIEVQQNIHSLEAHSLEPMSLKLRKQIEVAKQLNNRQKDALLGKMEMITYKPTLCHGDFHLFNLILSDQNEQVTIIDWVDATAGDLRADVYRTYLLYEQFSPDLANMYLRLYCQKSGLPEEEIFQWAPIIAGARLSENVSSENTERLLKIVHSFINH